MPYCVPGRTNPERRCRICGEPIRFIRTKKGKPTPVDAAPAYYIPNPNGPALYVLEDGTTARGYPAGDAAEEVSVGYVSHFASCPGAADMRKG